MKFKLLQYAGGRIAELMGNTIVISNLDDALDVIGNATQQGSQSIIVHRHQLHSDFFNLRTGLAGEILQKFSTYRVQLAIVGDFDTIISKSLKDFMYESNKYGQIYFANTVDQAVKHIAQLK